MITENSTDTTKLPTDKKIEESNLQQPKHEQSSEELNVICAKLCSLMKAQLVKSHDEVMSR